MPVRMTAGFNPGASGRPATAIPLSSTLAEDPKSLRVASRTSVRPARTERRKRTGWGELEPALAARVDSERTSERVTPILWESFDSTTREELEKSAVAGDMVAQTALDDDRTRVVATENDPWCWICSLLITTTENRRCKGTGWLVGARTVVTAGHCVYTRHAGWVKHVEVLVGRNVSNRLSAHVSSDLHSVRGWTVDHDWEYDYGAIVLAEPVVPKRSFRCDVLSDERLQTLQYAHVAGYPHDKQPEGSLWCSGKPLAEVRSRSLLYRLSTFFGQSGAPVFYKDNEDRFAVGIHAYGGRQANYGVNFAIRMTADVQRNIREWCNLSSDVS